MVEFTTKIGFEILQVFTDYSIDKLNISKLSKLTNRSHVSLLPHINNLIEANILLEEKKCEPKLLKSVIEVNTCQKTKPVEVLDDKTGSLEGKTIAVLELSFKPGTDDVRKSPAIKIIQELKEKGAKVKAYDPEAMENMEKIHPDVKYVGSYQEALRGVDAGIIATDWEEFNKISLEDTKTMKNPIIIEGRKTDAEVEKEGVLVKC